MFENSVLRVIYRLMRDEVKGEWIKLYKEGFNDLHSPPNTVGVIKSRKKRWAAHVESGGQERCLQSFSG
jgi:hypothetical protein